MDWIPPGGSDMGLNASSQCAVSALLWGGGGGERYRQRYTYELKVPANVYTLTLYAPASAVPRLYISLLYTCRPTFVYVAWV